MTHIGGYPGRYDPRPGANWSAANQTCYLRTFAHRACDARRETGVATHQPRCERSFRLATERTAMRFDINAGKVANLDCSHWKTRAESCLRGSRESRRRALISDHLRREHNYSV